MLSFRNINNATVIINDTFIFDPWIYGHVFYKMWRPYPNPEFNKNDLNKIKFCFISHVHQDHWDIDTIKYFRKDTKFFIPDLPYNYVISNTLRKKGFNKIVLLKMGEWNKISNDFKISVIPPLNSEGAEVENIKSEDDNHVAIDTGILINFLKDNSYHLLLGDNVPYDYNLYNKLYGKIKITSLFFPHNGFATDYPICYDNFSLKQKKKLSNLKAKKTEERIVSFINKTKPKITIPFSAQFLINNSRFKDFNKINNEIFFHKDLYAQRIMKLTNIPSAILYSEDFLHYKNNTFTNVVNSTFYSRRKDSGFKINYLKNIPSLNKINLIGALNDSLEKYFNRLNKYKIKINFKKIKLIFNVNKNHNYIIDFEKKIVTKNNLPKNNFLKLKIKKNILLQILFKKLHINNCVVSFVLSWERKPNRYYKTFYNSLSFFHV